MRWQCHNGTHQFWILTDGIHNICAALKRNMILGQVGRDVVQRFQRFHFRDHLRIAGTKCPNLIHIEQFPLSEDMRIVLDELRYFFIRGGRNACRDLAFQKLDQQCLFRPLAQDGEIRLFIQSLIQRRI